MLLSLTSYLQQIVSYSYTLCTLVTAHLDCLCRTTRITLITMEIISPITAIANNAIKAMINPLLSPELPSLLVSVEKDSYIIVLIHI